MQCDRATVGGEDQVEGDADGNGERDEEVVGEIVYGGDQRAERDLERPSRPSEVGSHADAEHIRS